MKLPLSVVLASCLVSAVAIAGQQSLVPVQLIGDSTVLGMLTYARASSDANQRIGCGTTSFPGGEVGICAATTATGAQAMCITDEPTMLADIRALDGEGFLQFSWDKTGACTGLVRWTSSDLRQ